MKILFKNLSIICLILLLPHTANTTEPINLREKYAT